MCNLKTGRQGEGSMHLRVFLRIEDDFRVFFAQFWKMGFMTSKKSRCPNLQPEPGIAGYLM
jgi:hypothetical protein